MLGAVSSVQAATYRRLERQYAVDLGEDVAGLLAAAIVNELFGQESDIAAAISFRKEKCSLITLKLSELKNDLELRIAVTQANRVLAAVQCSKDSDASRIVAHFKKLDKLGILVPNSAAPTLSTFMPLVQKYYKDNVGETEP